MGIPVFPLAPLSKTPLLKGENWREIASTDVNTISQWFRDTKNANYGVVCGADSDLFVIDIDSAEADAWWRSKGLDEGAVVRTPSGGRHIYYRSESVDIQTNQSIIFKGVDVRGFGGYVVGPGSMLATGSYIGDISRIPMASAEVIALLPEKQTYTYEPEAAAGDKPAAATPSEFRRIKWITDSLDALPRVWIEGAGWRSTFFSSACWLSRMINSDQYALTEDAALAIVLEHTPTDAEWGLEDILLQWASARKTTAGQVAEPPVETLPPLLPLLDTMNLLPEFTSRGESFTDLIFNLPSVETEKSFWMQRQTILQESFRAGLTDQQAATIGWGAKVSETLQMEPGGLSKVWGDVAKARLVVARESGEGNEPPAAEDRPALKLVKKGPEHVQILTDVERKSILGYDWFGESYMAWARSMVPVFNAPYHRLMRMLVLSVVFSDMAYVPGQGDPIWLNLYAIVLGESTTGKSESYSLAKRAIGAAFKKGESPIIGGNASENGLLETLIQRDGLTTLFSRDEAHEFFKAAKSQSWLSGLVGTITDVYGGEVKPLIRAGKSDFTGIEAKAFMSMSLTGVESLMAEVLDDSYWRSGLLPRCLWAIGEDVSNAGFIPTVEHLGNPMTEYEAMPRHWASEFTIVKHKLNEIGALPLPVTTEPAALARFDKARRDIDKALRNHPRYVEMGPTMIRFWINIRKCAALIALSEGEAKVSLAHELIALEMAEEWLGNALWMAESTSATSFSRDVDKLESFIAGSDTGEVKMERVYSFFMKSGVGKRFVDDFVAQLISEGRITKPQRQGENNYVLKINSREKRAA
jgi:hypothetical protein